MVRGLGPRDRAAIYALGRNLHVLQDFTDDPGKLLAALSHVDSGRDLMPANVHDALFGFPVDMTGNIQGIGRADPGLNAMYQRSIQDSAELNARVNAADNEAITVEALRRIVEHLSGMPGRRNLVWLMDQPMVPPAVMGMLLQADIHLYPVLIRTVEYDVPDFMGTQKAGRDLAALTGGAGFDDALDLQLAVQTAEDDSQTAYTLGYYPSEEVLDGQYHRITVKLAGKRRTISQSTIGPVISPLNRRSRRRATFHKRRRWRNFSGTLWITPGLGSQAGSSPIQGRVCIRCP